METSNMPVVIWFAVASAMVLIALYGFYRYSHKHQKRSIHAIEIGSEAEEIYVPGDRTRFDKEDYNDED